MMQVFIRASIFVDSSVADAADAASMPTRQAALPPVDLGLLRPASSARAESPARHAVCRGTGVRRRIAGGRWPARACRNRQRRSSAMDWNRIEGNWKQVKGRVKEQWGKLTDDDLDVINGRREQLAGKMQERYGIAKDEADRQIDTWVRGAQDDWFESRSKATY
jgi:uncharacterized protein YjbJ (UPF0337 family)